ncbi:TMV resistance protein N, partial [Tanacetum coccineum]
TKTGNFIGLDNLEELKLAGCLNLVELDSSIGCLQKLVELNLSDCSPLKTLPWEAMSKLTALQSLNLENFPNILEISHEVVATSQTSSLYINVLQPSRACAEYVTSQSKCMLIGGIIATRKGGGEEETSPRGCHEVMFLAPHLLLLNGHFIFHNITLNNLISALTETTTLQKIPKHDYVPIDLLKKLGQICSLRVFICGLRRMSEMMH